MKTAPHRVARLLGALLLLRPLLAGSNESVPAVALKDAFRDHFPVGVAVNRGIVTGSGFRRTPDLVAKDIALTRAQFNQIAPENDMKWALIHPREGADGYEFGPADAFVAFGEANGMAIAGHTLVWHSQTPDWVFAGTNPPPAPGAQAAPAGQRRFGPYAGPRASRDELLGRMRDHIHTVVGRYRGRIQAWDVVNEALADGDGPEVLRDSLWHQIIGPDYIAKAFQYAHEADPKAILRYNDYGLENPAKRRRLLTLVRSLQEQGIPVHAIGSQAHLNVGTSFETMDASLSEMKSLGLPIHITELDVNSARRGQRGTGASVDANADATRGGLVEEADRKLAEAYAGVFRAILRHRDAVKVVTFWGVNDAVSWRAAGRPLLFDGDNRPKPAFHAVIAEAQSVGTAR